MSKQRRKRLNRVKRTRSRRSFIRNGVEQLESRVLPGGFLDLLAGAALAATFDLLPAEQFIPEEIEAESEAFTRRERPTNALLQTDLSSPDIDLEPQEGHVELTPFNEDLDVTPALRATTSLLVAASFVDSFFTNNQFIDTSPHVPVFPSRALSTPSPSFKSPIGQLGSGVGSGSGQGFNVTGAELPQASVASAPIAASSFPAWMMGEGEGGASASGSGLAVASGSGTATATGTATSSASGSGVATTMVSATATSSGSGTTQTVSSCEGVPTVAGPSVIRFGSTTTGTPEPEGWAPPWTTLDDAANEGVVLGNPAWDEADDFYTPNGIPFYDQSFLAWAEVRQHRSYVEWVHGTSRGNGELVPRDITFKWTHAESHSSISTNSASISGAITGQLGNIGTEMSATLETNVSSSSTVEEEENFSVPACSVKSLYDQYEIIEVQVEYVFYHDIGIFGFSKEHSTMTIVSTNYLGNTTKVASGNIVTHTVTV